MAQPYVGEIRMFAGNFAPSGWEFCAGQLVQISENETLFQLIGTTYGGDGQSTYALPDFRGRIPIHFGTADNVNYQIGQTGGAESVTLTSNQIPVHTHAMLASTSTGTQNSPDGAILASGSTISLYRPIVPNQPMAAGSIGPAGGSQPHDNMHPYLCVSFIISLFGIFPSPT